MKQTLKFFQLIFLLVLAALAACSDDDEEVNLAPEAADQTFSLAISSPSGTVVGTVTTIDAEQDPLTFSIISGNTGDAFTINASTGQITVNAPSALASGTNNTFVLTVEVSDGQNEISVTITINLVDLSPVVADQAFSIDENSENGSDVGTLVATDPNQASLTFSIVSGNTGDAFAINASTGQITVETSAALDFEVTPSFSLVINASNGSLETTATITITLNDIAPEPFTTRQQIIEALNSSYDQLESYVEFTYLFDAVYANRINAPNADWNAIFSHSQTAENAKVSQLWNDAFAVIFVLNNIISSAEAVLPAELEQDEIIAQALAIRAYLQFQLVSWFGSIPLETGLVSSDPAFSLSSGALDQVKADLNVAINTLPASWTGDNEDNFTKGTAQALLLRVYTFNEEWAEAAPLAQELIDNTSYSLSPTTNNFTATDSEIIWGFAQTGEAVFSGAYDRGDYVPLVRLTETYLTSAEAYTFLGQSVQASDALNALKDRAGEAPVGTGLNSNEFLEITFDQWEAEMDLGGVSFSILKRFGQATTRLTLQDTQLILPIPQDIIFNYSSATQNPGY